MKAFFFSLLFAASLVACKKETEPMLEGKWTLSSIVVKEYQNGALTFSDFAIGNGQTFEFHADGTLVFTENGNVQTTTYSLNGDKVTFGGDTYDIQNLSDHSVTLFYKEYWGIGISNEISIHLAR